MSNNFTCHNCGRCCKQVPIIESDSVIIQKYLSEHPDIQAYAKAKGYTPECIFRNNPLKKCMIYPVRPHVCKHSRCDRPYDTKSTFHKTSFYVPLYVAWAL